MFDFHITFIPDPNKPQASSYNTKADTYGGAESNFLKEKGQLKIIYIQQKTF
jgi:hypothetical protein